MLKNWPTTIPQNEVWAVILDVLDGKIDDPEAACYCLYQVMGFAAGKAFGSPQVMHSATSEPATAVQRGEARSFVADMASMRGPDAPKPVDGPWLSLILTLAPLITDIISRLIKR